MRLNTIRDIERKLDILHNLSCNNYELGKEINNSFEEFVIQIEDFNTKLNSYINKLNNQ